MGFLMSFVQRLTILKRWYHSNPYSRAGQKTETIFRGYKEVLQKAAYTRPKIHGGNWTVTTTIKSVDSICKN